MTNHSLVSLGALLALASCGGGGGGTSGAVSGIQGPEQVTIVESSQGSSLAVTLPRGVRGVAGSDYETDTTRFWVRDSSMESLDSVNMILGFLHQTRYWEQTNAGPYRALVEDRQRGDGGGERGESGPAYEEWVVDSTRASNDAPQIVKFWVNSEDNGQAQIIYGRLEVSEAPSDEQPLGSFTLYFKGLPDGVAPTSTATTFEGYLRTVARNDGQTEVEFYNGHGDVGTTPGVGEYAMRERAHVIGDFTAGTGRAYTERRYVQNHGGSTYTDEGEYQIQFNADYVARKDVVANTTDVLDRNDYDTTVFRYGVYDATTEERVDQMSGFPIENGDGVPGWAGFHGIWFPESVTLTDGQTLYRRSFSSNTTTPYTLVIAPGKLEKRTRSSITLADLVDEDLNFYDQLAGAETKVRWTGSDIVLVAQRVSGEWQVVDPPVSMSGSLTVGMWLNFWSQARGTVEFSWPSTPSNSSPAFVWSRETVTGDDPVLASGDLTLYGYSRMLRAQITSDQANYQNSQSPYLPDASGVSTGNQTYVFDKETMMLQLGGQDVNFANGVSVTSGPGMFGLNCGPLFPTALTSFQDMANQTTTYEWVIGSNSWNQLRTLKDAQDQFVVFSAPTRLTYQHDENGSPFDGRTFFLEWDGANLGGIPFQQNETDGRWYPLFNIPSGTVVSGSGGTYKIKQLEGEQQMVAVGSPNTVISAQGFDLSITLSAPDATPYEDPAIGAMPVVTAAPLYVAGVSQVQ